MMIEKSIVIKTTLIYIFGSYQDIRPLKESIRRLTESSDDLWFLVAFWTLSEMSRILY